MAIQSSVFQAIQIGPETVPGTEVAADIKLPAIQFEIAIMPDIKTYRGTGYKHPAVAALNREWVEASLSGPVTYNEIVYLLSSIFDTTTVTNNTAANGEAIWAFAPDPDGPDVPITFTVEQGTAARAHLFTYGLVTALGFQFSRDGVELDGTMIGQALEDGITITPTPTELALKPVTATQVKVYLDSTWATLGTTLLQSVLSAEWNLSDRFGPFWPIDGETSFQAHVELVPTLEVKLKIATTDAGGQHLLLLGNMRAGETRFMRIEAIGDVIGTAVYHTLRLDAAIKVTDVEPFSDEDGVFAIEYTFEAFLDPTSSNVYTASVTNTLAAL